MVLLARKAAVVLVGRRSEHTTQSVAEFLSNAHFDVATISPQGEVSFRSRVGDSFLPPVVLLTAEKRTSLDQREGHTAFSTLRKAAERAGILTGPPSSWISFNGDADDPYDLDFLLQRLLTEISWTIRKSVREEIHRRSSGLLASTNRCYSDQKFVERYYELWRYNLPVRELKDFANILPRGARILDAGSGPGHHSDFLTECGNTIVGVDLSITQLLLARSRSNSRSSYVCADILQLPFIARCYDGVWCSATLVHLPLHLFDSALSELKRVLRPGGFVSFSVSVGKLPAVETDGRFFDSFKDESDVIRRCNALSLAVIKSHTNIMSLTTMGGRRIGKWLNVLAQRSI